MGIINFLKNATTLMYTYLGPLPVRSFFLHQLTVQFHHNHFHLMALSLFRFLTYFVMSYCSQTQTKKVQSCFYLLNQLN